METDSEWLAARIGTFAWERPVGIVFVWHSEPLWSLHVKLFLTREEWTYAHLHEVIAEFLLRTSIAKADYCIVCIVFPQPVLTLDSDNVPC